MTLAGVRRARDGAALIALSTAVACQSRGVVGVTRTSSLERDASTDAASRPRTDAMTGPDGSTGGKVVVDDCLPSNAAGLTPAVAKELVETAGDASSTRFLYPYDGTVYPQGIPGPVLMWDGPASDVVYVRLRSNRLDYQACLTPTGPNRVELPSGMWDLAAAKTGGEADPFTLELKVLAKEAVYGPISEQLVIAKGALRGSVYYMTTTSPSAVGGVLRVVGGRAAEPVLTAPSCAGCHSLSANGARLLAFSSGVGAAFDVSSSSTLPPLLTAAPGADFSAVYPDGSVYVPSARRSGSLGPRSYTGGNGNAALYDTSTGTVTGDGSIPPGASMPAFSFDGKQLVFTDLDAGGGHTLASMRFSIATRSASAYQTLYTSASQFVGWPSFLPDSLAVVFTQGSAADFSGNNVGLVPVVQGAPTDLFVLDTETKTVTPLAQAIGFRTVAELQSGNTYLPGGALDVHQNYYPAVSPAASGGYAWVFFDSARAYGNEPAHRAIWGTALTLSPDGSYLRDPSHPAFYLPGQGAATPNFRAVSVLDLER